MTRARRNTCSVVATAVCTAATALTAQTPGGSATCDLGAPTSRDAAWFPGGDRIAFSSNRSGNYEIWSVGLDGADPERLTRTDTNDYYPSVSPDGSEVGFTAYGDGGSTVSVVRLATGAVRALTDPADAAGDPGWSADGLALVYLSRRGGAQDLWTMAPDGSDPRPLFRLDGDEVLPRLSPDGTRVAFATDRDGDWEVYTAALDGTELRNVSDDPRWNGIPSWSPDGERLVFYGRHLPPAGARGSEWTQASWAGAEIYTAPATGGEVRALTDNAHLDQSPSWSPDGRLVAYTSCASGNREVWLMEADGSNSRRLTRTPALPHADSDARGQVRAVVEEFVAAWKAGDADRLRAVVAPPGSMVWVSGAADSAAVQSADFERILSSRRPHPVYELEAVRSLTVVDDRLASVDVEIRMSTGVFHDHYVLYRLWDGWRVAVKTFVLLGGGA